MRQTYNKSERGSDGRRYHAIAGTDKIHGTRTGYKRQKRGTCEAVGEGIRELKINYAKGYRVYFKETDGKIIILLIGGDKSSQQRDIEKAKEIWRKLKQ